MSSSTGKKLRAELPRRQRPHMLLHTPLASGSIDHNSWDIVRQQNREVTFANQLAKATPNPRWQADMQFWQTAGARRDRQAEARRGHAPLERKHSNLCSRR